MKICMSKRMKTAANRSSNAAAHSMLFCPPTREQEREKVRGKGSFGKEANRHPKIKDYLTLLLNMKLKLKKLHFDAAMHPIE